jgi:hypothetical protein
VHYVRAEAVGWIDEEWPGWVEVHLIEPDGTVVSIVEKVPILDYDDRVVPGIQFPVVLAIPCDVIDRATDDRGNRTVAIRLRCNVEDRQGRAVFKLDERALTARP